MPIEFDPAWEYWTPDPEVVPESPPAGGTLLDRLGFDGEDGGRRVVTGFRFGYGAALRYLPERLARERPSREVAPPRASRSLHCRGCGSPFSSTRRGTTTPQFCSRGCAAHAGGRPTTVPAQVVALRRQALTATEIAARLGVTPRHVRRVLQKTQESAPCRV